MAKKSTTQIPETARFVLLPLRGLRSQEMRGIGEKNPKLVTRAGARLTVLGDGVLERKPTMTLLHSMGDDGPKMVEMGAAEIAAMRVSDPGVRAVPLVKYDLMRMPVLEVESRPMAAAAILAIVLTIHFIDRKTKLPVAGVTVAAFTNFAQRVGVGSTSDASGNALLNFGGASVALEVLVAYGPVGYWGLGKKEITLKHDAVFELEPIDLTTPDYAAHLYAGVSPDAGEGVTVGVIDSGVDGSHPDLEVTGGGAFVTAEQDAGGSGPAATDGEHGTHVAGVIASKGLLHPQPPRVVPGKRGIAPKTKLYSYRVFPNAGGGADNYDITRAIDQGVVDKCDFLNLSLGTQAPEPLVEVAIKHAFDQGTLCIVAAGNDYRQSVSYPAAWDIAVAVSSAGMKGTYPAESNEILDETAMYAKTDANVYISAFSNVGPPVDFTGPGEGIVSTLPGGAYGVMSGTSMACPAVTGFAASLLSVNPTILNMPRDRARSIAMMGMLSKAASQLGFDPTTLEGAGMLF